MNRTEADRMLWATSQAEVQAYLELREVAAQWKALADWERAREAAFLAECDAPAPPTARSVQRIPLPARTDWSRTIPGMPSPLAGVQTDEEPFPLVTVRRLPGVPRALTPARGMPRVAWTPPAAIPPQHDPHSAFTRMLAWTLKSRR